MKQKRNRRWDRIAGTLNKVEQRLATNAEKDDYLFQAQMEVRGQINDEVASHLKSVTDALSKQSTRTSEQSAVSNSYLAAFDHMLHKPGRIPKLMDIFHDYRPLIPEDSLFDLWDYKVGFLDAKSLWIQLNELVLREEYFFSDDFKAPHRIIDCGSNIGLSLLFFKAVYPNSQVMAFEPEPNCFKVASENLKRNNLEGVDLQNAAIGSENGKLNLFINTKDSMGSSLNPRRKDNPSITEKIEVDVVALGDCLETPVDFLKLDIEGNEADVLKALGSKIQNAKQIFCEYHFSSDNNSNSLRDIIDLLDDNNFDYQIAKSVWFGEQSEYRPMTHVGKDYSGVIYAKTKNA